MTDYKTLHIPHLIKEFDDQMLVPLAGNFSEVQRHVAMTQARVTALETRVTALEALHST